MIKLDNRTPFAAYVAAGGVPPNSASFLKPEPVQWRVQVVVKATFWVKEGKLVPDPEQVPILPLGKKTDDGFMEGDLASDKSGADLVVVGSAHAPRGAPVREMPVTLRLDGFTRTLRVTGDRLWEKQKNTWKATDPLPFAAMPLCYERAFGGTYRFDDGSELPFANNPVGKGWTPRIAGIDFAGRPLPNVEAPARCVSSPEDEPDPAGFAWYRVTWGLRLSKGLEMRGNGPPRPLPRLWNAAHPDLVLDRYPQGQDLRLDGMSPDGAMEFVVPRLPVNLEHALSGRPERVPAAPDTLCILPSRRRLFVVARWLLPYDPKDRAVSREIRLVPDPAR